MTGDFNCQIPTTFSESLSNLISLMLDRDMDVRPTIGEVLQSNFVREYKIRIMNESKNQIT